MNKSIYGYEITRSGDVISKRLGTPMKLTLSGTSRDGGYLQTNLKIDGKHVCKRAHRLVAEAYIDNPDNKPCVNHIDGNKLNNNVSNLEWCTHLENVTHARTTGLTTSAQCPTGAAHARAVLIRCIDTGDVFSGAGEAMRALGLTDAARKNITNVCKGRRKVAGGYRWEYVSV